MMHSKNMADFMSHDLKNLELKSFLCNGTKSGSLRVMYTSFGVIKILSLLGNHQKSCVSLEESSTINSFGQYSYGVFGANVSDPLKKIKWYSSIPMLSFPDLFQIQWLPLYSPVFHCKYLLCVQHNQQDLKQWQNTCKHWHQWDHDLQTVLPCTCVDINKLNYQTF